MGGIRYRKSGSLSLEVFYLVFVAGAVAQWVECATPSKEVMGSFPAVAGVSIM